MTDQSKKPTKKIVAPEKFPLAENGRAAARAAVGSIPIVGAVASEAVDAFLPNPEADDQDRWSGEITDGVNSLNERVEDIDGRTGKRTISLIGATALAAKYMIEKCLDGLRHEHYSLVEILEAYPELSKDELLDGLGELEVYGFITTISFIGAPDEYRLTASSYEVLDEPIMGWNTENDARHLAEKALAYRGSVNVAKLHSETGWSYRRFNPALRMVVDFIGDGRVSRSIQPEYISRWFTPNNVERTLLRQFVREA